MRVRRYTAINEDNVVSAQFEVIFVWNRSPGKAAAHAEEHGTRAVEELDELCECDVLILCLSTSADVEALLASDVVSAFAI